MIQHAFKCHTISVSTWPIRFIEYFARRSNDIAKWFIRCYGCRTLCEMPGRGHMYVFVSILNMRRHTLQLYL